MLTMDGLNTVFLLLSFISAAFAYNCIEKACYSGQCIGAGTTCPANGTNGCVINGFSGFATGKVYNCSSDPCVPTWNNITGSVFTTDCCFTERCNSDSMSSNTVGDPNKDECYSAACDYEGCLSEAILNNNTRVCQRPENGYCMTTETEGMHSTSCTPGPCSNVNLGSVKVTCCTGHLCNSPSAPPTTNDPNAGQCYSVSCFTEGCLSEAISGGTAGFCPRPPGGNCMSVKQMGTDPTLESAGCYDGADASCANMATYDFPPGLNIFAQCCNEELCNDGIRKEIPDNSCYAVTCNYTGCIEDAMQKGVYAYCPQMGYGCLTTFAAGLYIATCSPQACFPIDMESIKVECCSGHLCNAPQGFTRPLVTSSTVTGTSEVSSITRTGTYEVSSSTGTGTSEVSSSTGTGTEATTKKDTSGAGTLRFSPYFICFLVILLLSVVT